MYSCKGKTQKQLHQIFNDPNRPITLCWDNGSGGELVNSTCEVARHYCPNLTDKEAEQGSPGSHRDLTSKLGQKQGLRPLILIEPMCSFTTVFVPLGRHGHADVPRLKYPSYFISTTKCVVLDHIYGPRAMDLPKTLWPTHCWASANTMPKGPCGKCWWL